MPELDVFCARILGSGDAAAQAAHRARGGSEDRIEQRMELSGRGHKQALLSAYRSGIGINLLIVFHRSLVETAAKGHIGLASNRLGSLQNNTQASTLGRCKGRLFLHAVVVRKDRDLVVRCECILQGVQRVVDLGHGVEGHALVDDQRNRHRRGIAPEHHHLLTQAILVDAYIAPRQRGNQLILTVFDGEGNRDEVYVHTQHRNGIRTTRRWSALVVVVGGLRAGRG